MSMTVKRLILELKRLPQDSLVVVRNHDQSVDEMDGYVHFVGEAEDALRAARNSLGERDKLVVIQL